MDVLRSLLFTVKPVLCDLNFQGNIELGSLKTGGHLIQVPFKINKRSCTRKELEPLLGHLNVLSLVILPCRAFVTYLYKLISWPINRYKIIQQMKNNTDIVI
jgi:hypothetical protein